MIKDIEDSIALYHKEHTRTSIEEVIGSFIQCMVEKDEVIIPIQRNHEYESEDLITFSIKKIRTKEGEQALVCFTSEEMLNKGEATDFDEVDLCQYVKLALKEEMSIVFNPFDKPFILKAETLKELMEYLDSENIEA